MDLSRGLGCTSSEGFRSLRSQARNRSRGPLICAVMGQEPDQSVHRVFWIMYNCSLFAARRPSIVARQVDQNHSHTNSGPCQLAQSNRNLFLNQRRSSSPTISLPLNELQQRL